jgi:hypothetical protein
MLRPMTENIFTFDCQVFGFSKMDFCWRSATPCHCVAFPLNEEGMVVSQFCFCFSSVQNATQSTSSSDPRAFLFMALRRARRAELTKLESGFRAISYAGKYAICPPRRILNS